MNQEIISFVKVVALRFLKGAIAGALASVAMATINAPQTWQEMSTALIALTWAAVGGAITGGFLAIEKAYKYTPQR